MDVELEYPSWLSHLSYNCELSTDMIDYEVPFENEFKYIAESELWRSVNSLEEFNQKYDREIVESYQVNMKIISSSNNRWDIISIIVAVIIFILYKLFL